MDCPTCLNGLPSPKPSVPSPTRSRPPLNRAADVENADCHYIETETARRIKMLAVQRDTTLQALGVEAWHLLLEHYE